MFEKSEGTFTVYCEERGCSATGIFRAWNDFQEYLRQKKAAGWRTTKDAGGHWVDKCPAHAGNKTPVKLLPSKPGVKKYVLRPYDRSQR